MARPARRRAPVLFALLGAAVVIAGCGGAEPVAPPGPFPPRPADIDVLRLDPCELVTPEQRSALGVDDGEARTGRLSSGETRVCLWHNFDDGYNFTAQTVAGPSAATAAGAPDTSVESVAGYGAARTTDFGDSAPLCGLVIDAADDAAIRVQAQATGRGPDGSRQTFDQVCAKASDVATDVIGNATSAG
ncbi:DUF3558 family protein [Pseudonocardia nantongensis]|uniref:DUF3558 family protein n=1 Tax=Pseudonocardia nantongensis TaxID=1181885 RepID=UPI00397C854D